MNSHARYVKTQTLWTRRPAAIATQRGTSTITVVVYPSHDVDGPVPEPAFFTFKPQEAQAFAARLSDQAEFVIAKQRRAEARRAARAAAKQGVAP